MPVSDCLLAIVLALNPQTEHKLAITLSAAALSQPNGGSQPHIVLVQTKDDTKHPKATMESTAPKSCLVGQKVAKSGKCKPSTDVKNHAPPEKSKT